MILSLLENNPDMFIMRKIIQAIPSNKILENLVNVYKNHLNSFNLEYTQKAFNYCHESEDMDVRLVKSEIKLGWRKNRVWKKKG